MASTHCAGYTGQLQTVSLPPLLGGGDVMVTEVVGVIMVMVKWEWWW